MGYDKAHADDCIDSVTFSSSFSWGGNRSVTDSIGSASAAWRSSMSGAVVFSEALFGGRPKSALTDLVDGFTVSCQAGVTYEPNGTRVGTNVVVDKDDAGESVEDSRVLDTLGTLFDTVGPLALPLAPLVVLYVVVDEITDKFSPNEIQNTITSAIDWAAGPFVRLTDAALTALDRAFG